MNINQLMKQAQMAQKKLNKVQKEFNEKVFDFKSNDSLISGQMKGNMEIVSLTIDPSLVKEGNGEILADMLCIILNETRNKIAVDKETEIGKIAGNVNIPNLF